MMGLNKHELELEKLRIRAQTKGAWLDLAKTVAQLSAAIAFSYLLFECLRSIVTANPEGIKALAELVKNMSLDRIFLLLLSGGTTTAWYLERQGKKRMAKDYADRRNQIEKNDSYTASSGLTTTGDTPK